MVCSIGDRRACRVVGASLWPPLGKQRRGPPPCMVCGGEGHRAGTPELPLAGNPQRSPQSSRWLPMLTFRTPI